jgi:hypothetical protein
VKSASGVNCHRQNALAPEVARHQSVHDRAEFAFNSRPRNQVFNFRLTNGSQSVDAHGALRLLTPVGLEILFVLCEIAPGGRQLLRDVVSDTSPINYLPGDHRLKHGRLNIRCKRFLECRCSGRPTLCLGAWRRRSRRREGPGCGCFVASCHDATASSQALAASTRENPSKAASTAHGPRTRTKAVVPTKHSAPPSSRMCVHAGPVERLPNHLTVISSVRGLQESCADSRLPGTLMHVGHAC